MKGEKDLRQTDNEEVEQLVENMTLLDDILMTKVFDGNIPATQRLINIILKRDDIIVQKVVVQKMQKNPLVGGYDVRLDIFAVDNNGNHYNIEVQREDAGADRRRARFNSASLDLRMLKHGQNFKELKDSYVIFITKNDIFRKGCPLYHIDRAFRESGEWFDDGNHIIYANASYQNDSDDIGRLMHDFREHDPARMYIRELRDGVSHFKKPEGGQKTMVGSVEEYAKKYAKKYAKEYAKGREDRGKILGAIEFARSQHSSESDIKNFLMKEYKLSESDAASYLHPKMA